MSAKLSLAAKFTDQQRLELTPNHKNSIHLWQFLAELLNQDKWTCIKWIQREKGYHFILIRQKLIYKNI